MPGADEIPGLYERHASLFDADRDRSLFEKPWLDRFCALLAPGARILDLGCGSGEPIANYLIGKGFTLTGCDSSPSLLATARRRHPGGDWIEADMRSARFDKRFDGVIAWHSLFHLKAPDQRALIPRLGSYLEPGGMLMFTSGSEAGEVYGTFGGEPLYHASLDSEEYRQLLDRTRFDILDHRRNDEECGGATVWLARKIT